jgi:hypothetical protein
MSLKSILAGSLCVTILGLACPVPIALADGTPPSSNPYMTPINPYVAPSSPYMATSSSNSPVMTPMSPMPTTAPMAPMSSMGSSMYPMSTMPMGEDLSLMRGHITTIPKGTVLMVKIDHPVSSFSSKIGDPVTAVVEADVYLENQVAIPAGSQIEGAITGVSPAGRLGKNAELELQFYTIKPPYGAVIPIRAHIVTADSSGVIKGGTDQARVLQSLGVAAGSTAAGTLMGTAAGSLLGSVGGGAIFGVAAGGLFGLGYAIARQGKQVELPTGARMSIVLDQPVATPQ